MKATRWMVLAAAMVTAACGGDDGGSTGPGNGGTPSFEADVTGDVQVSIAGDAAYGNVDDAELGTIFAVEMSEDAQTGGGLIQLIRIGGGTPNPGTYPITDGINGNPGNGDWVAVAYDTEQGEMTAVFVATGGTVKVTSVSNGIAKGTFNFNAEGGILTDPETTLSIAVQGKFTAGHMAGGTALRAQPKLRSR